ncbi:hypothetical protein Tco_0991638 [Tanacetum coccineum]|uniref:Transposase (Putative), gypsy type n=1 Tax=Tanacetum coccineum TaxID=301880 RepID=A0ABQ5F0W3_9ASTR
MGRDIIQLETAVSTISSEYLLEFTSEYGITEELHLELPSPRDRIVDFLEDERVFPTMVDWRVSAPKDEMPVAGSYSPEDVVVLNTRRTPIQKQPEALLCLVGLSRRYFLGDDVYPTFLNDDDREMDLFNLISAPNLTKVKTGTHPRVAHEVPLLIATATRVIAMEDAIGLSSSSGTPSIVEKSPLDFSNEDSPRRITESDGTENQGQETVAHEVPPRENVPTVGVTPEIGLEKEVAAMGPLPYQSHGLPREAGIRWGDPDSEVVYLFYNPLKESHNVLYQAQEFRVSIMGSQLRLRFEQEVQLLKRATEKVAKRDQRIQAREEEIKKLDQEIHSLKSADTEVQGLRGEEAIIKAAFKEFKRYEDDKVEQRCAEMDARLDKLSIDFDEELYPHMLTAIIRQAFADVVSVGLAKGMSEGLQYGIEYGKAGRDLGGFEAWYAIQRPLGIKEELSLEDAIATNIKPGEGEKRNAEVGVSQHTVLVLLSMLVVDGVACISFRPRLLRVLHFAQGCRHTQTEGSEGSRIS